MLGTLNRDTDSAKSVTKTGIARRLFRLPYIAKFYVDEADSEAVRRLAETLGQVHCCALGRIEVAGVFRLKWREGTFTEREFREVSSQFVDALWCGTLGLAVR